MHSNNPLLKRPPNIVQLTAIACRAGKDARDGKDCIKCNHQRAISLPLSISFLRPNLLTLSLAAQDFTPFVARLRFLINVAMFNA